MGRMSINVGRRLGERIESIHRREIPECLAQLVLHRRR
jgi:hypothetical protein